MGVLIRVPFSGAGMGAYARRYAALEAAGQLAFHFEWRAQTHRDKVLAVLAEADTFLIGQEVARRAGLPYKAALDALTYLYNDAKIARSGRKFTARWGKMSLQHADKGYRGLECFFRCVAPDGR